MEKFRWAYIGSGSIAKSTARDIIKGNHRLVSVYSRNIEKARLEDTYRIGCELVVAHKTIADYYITFCEICQVL